MALTQEESIQGLLNRRHTLFIVYMTSFFEIVNIMVWLNLIDLQQVIHKHKYKQKHI